MTRIFNVYTSCILKSICLKKLCPICRGNLIETDEDYEIYNADNFLEFFTKDKVYRSIEELNFDLSFVEKIKNSYQTRNMEQFFQAIENYENVKPLSFRVSTYLLKIDWGD